MKRSNGVYLIRKEDHEQLFQLRSECYRREYGDKVETSVLRWNSWDQRFINLGVYDENMLIALLRIAHVKNEAEFKRMMLCDLDPEKIQLPIVILNRAATHEKYESQGFHTLLRLHAFRLTKRASINWIAGTLKKESKRINQLKSLGYELSVNPKPWEDFLKSDDETFVVSLNLKNYFELAEARMLSSISDLAERYPAQYDSEMLLKRILEA